MGYGTTGISTMDTASYTPHLSLNSPIFLFFFFFNNFVLNFPFWELGLVGSWLCDGVIFISWHCQYSPGDGPEFCHGVWHTWDSFGMAKEPHTSVRSSFGEHCRYFPDEAKPWRFLKFCPSTCWVEHLSNALAAGLIFFRSCIGGWNLNPKEPPKHKKN